MLLRGFVVYLYLYLSVSLSLSFKMHRLSAQSRANPGVFVVRFSDASDASSSSRPVITFVAQDGNVHHYKLTDKEKKMPFHVRIRSLISPS